MVCILRRPHAQLEPPLCLFTQRCALACLPITALKWSYLLGQSALLRPPGWPCLAPSLPGPPASRLLLGMKRPGSDKRKLLPTATFIISGSFSLCLFSFLRCWRPSVGPPQTVPAWAPVQPRQHSPTTGPGRGVGSRGEEGWQEGSGALEYDEASANPKFPGRDFPQETARQ